MVAQCHVISKSNAPYLLQRAYSLLVRLHDDYGMHSIFAPGFPGLLEAFYVQERLMEHLMPDVYQSFVGIHRE